MSKIVWGNWKSWISHIWINDTFVKSKLTSIKPAAYVPLFVASVLIRFLNNFFISPLFAIVSLPFCVNNWKSQYSSRFWDNFIVGLVSPYQVYIYQVLLIRKIEYLLQWHSEIPFFLCIFYNLWHLDFQWRCFLKNYVVGLGSLKQIFWSDGYFLLSVCLNINRKRFGLEVFGLKSEDLNFEIFPFIHSEFKLLTLNYVIV